MASSGHAEGLSEVEAEIYRLTVVNRLSQTAIAESLEMHLAIQRRALDLAEMDGAPVTAGKDGDLVVDPKTGQHVRDYSLRLQAFEAARKSDVEIRKLYGLDAASKTEVSGSVRYEVASVDLDALS